MYIASFIVMCVAVAVSAFVGACAGIYVGGMAMAKGAKGVFDAESAKH